MTIGERIRELREERDMKQVELAKLCFWNRSKVSQIERGTRGTSIYDVIALCKVFGVSADYMLGLSEQREAVRYSER